VTTAAVTTVDHLLATQAGVISREQALAAGLSADAVDHRLRTRRWRPLHPRVYLAATYPLGDEARVRAALCWAGADAVLSGAAAAWWHGLLDQAPATVGVTVARRRCPRARPGVLVRRRDLPVADQCEHRTVAVTGPALSALEAAVELGFGGAALLDQVLQRSLPFPAVYAAYRRNLGAHGSATAGRLLSAAADRSSASAERRLARLLCEAGLRGWRRRVPAHCGLPGVEFPLERVAVGVHGWAGHPPGVSLRAGEPGPRGPAAGWTGLRFGWDDLTHRPDRVLGEIRSALRGARNGCLAGAARPTATPAGARPDSARSDSARPDSARPHSGRAAVRIG